MSAGPNLDSLEAVMQADTVQLAQRMLKHGRTTRSPAAITKRRRKHRPPQRHVPAGVAMQVTSCVVPKEGLEYATAKHLPLNHGFHTKLKGMHSALARALLANTASRGAKSASASAPVVVPVSSAEHDSLQLEWGRDGPLCAAGSACEAAKLTQSQGPLHAYCPPVCNSQPPTHPTCNLCLLCIRLHTEMLCKELRALQPPNVALASTMLPPFTNLVNAPGGYYAWCLGVSAVNHGLFDRQCSIVGASPLLTVKYSPLEEKWWVCQEKLIWRPSPLDFRQGAQEKLMSN